MSRERLYQLEKGGAIREARVLSFVLTDRGLLGNRCWRHRRMLSGHDRAHGSTPPTPYISICAHFNFITVRSRITFVQEFPDSCPLGHLHLDSLLIQTVGEPRIRLTSATPDGGTQVTEEKTSQSLSQFIEKSALAVDVALTSTWRRHRVAEHRRRARLKTGSTGRGLRLRVRCRPEGAVSISRGAGRRPPGRIPDGRSVGGSSISGRSPFIGSQALE